MARKLVMGNWKLNGNVAANAALLAGLARDWRPAPGVQMVVCPPAVYLAQTAAALRSSPIAWGAQDASEYASGAYTGEISVAMLKEAGCGFAIVGHSERRRLFGDTDERVARKAKAVLEGGLVPVVCVGESLEDRNQGRALEVLRVQVEAVLAQIPALSLPGLAIAYEPLWAIGTGRNASVDDVAEAHAHLRALLAKADLAAAAEVPILYGGSVKAANAAEYAAQRDVDGVLVGGASLLAPEFLAIGAAFAAGR